MFCILKEQKYILLIFQNVKKVILLMIPKKEDTKLSLKNAKLSRKDDDDGIILQ